MRAAFDFLAGDDGLLDGIKDQVKGEKGVPGGDGINGQKGLSGQKGAPGDDGSVTQIVFAFGTNTSDNLPKSGTFPADWDSAGVPTTTIALKSGESAIDTRSNTLWMFLPGTNSANWVNVGTKATGPKGEVGAKGDSGDKGSTGSTGAAGTNGADAAKGQKGETADKGQKGVVGDKGAKGEMGQTGNKGQKGSTGLTGGAGTKGEKGASGVKGLDGNKGTKGNLGTAGTSGAKGHKGEDAPSSNYPKTIIAFNSTGSVVDATITPLHQFNVYEVKKLAVGTFRIRFRNKAPRDSVIVFAQAKYPGRADCVASTQWTATIEVRDGSGNLSDNDYITAMVYCPFGGYGSSGDQGDGNGGY
jgi:hypothetical protein